MSEQDNKRKQEIRSIHADSSLTPEEKTRRIQELYSASALATASAAMATKPCTHYEKKCNRFTFDCCQTEDACHRCHGEFRECTTKPPKISSIVCMDCDLRQPPAASCTQCSVKFSESYCAACKIWTDKLITHCVKCGFCRIGKVGSLIHCDRCNLCWNTLAFDGHTCNKIATDEQCPVCFESVHNSQKSTITLSKTSLLLIFLCN